LAHLTFSFKVSKFQSFKVSSFKFQSFTFHSGFNFHASSFNGIGLFQPETWNLKPETWNLKLET